MTFSTSMYSYGPVRGGPLRNYIRYEPYKTYVKRKTTKKPTEKKPAEKKPTEKKIVTLFDSFLSPLWTGSNSVRFFGPKLTKKTDQ